jgi:poly(A) polymerase
MSLSQLLADGAPVMELALRFARAGHELYLVGGPVRDALLSRPASLDVDLATDATPDQVQGLLEDAASKLWLQGARFGTVGAMVSNTMLEITTFRTERYQPASRHPEVSFAPDIHTDLMRRDFTVNAMAIKLPDKTSVDPFGGVADLKLKILRTPQDPLDSFSDDPLRMLRAFRFMSQLEFEIEDRTFDAIVELRDQIRHISAERIRDELSKLLIGAAPARALTKADESGLLDLVLPEMTALKLEQDPQHRHKDVFKHTLVVLERTPPVLVLRLAALLHDIGKPSTRKIEADRGVTFHHHEARGARMAGKRLKELRFSNDVIDEVTHLVAMHGRANEVQLWGDSAVRRYVREAGKYLEDLISLVRADCTTRNKAKAAELAARMDDLEERIAVLSEKEELDRIRPELNGNEIMEHLGIPPGPEVGRAWEFLLEIRLEEGEIGREEALSRLDSWAEENGLR